MIDHFCYVYVWLELLRIFLPNKTFNHYVKKKVDHVEEKCIRPQKHNKCTIQT